VNKLKKALIVTDIQNDFCPGGSLAVQDGDQVIPFVNELIANNGYDIHIYTKDWHPNDHKSFITQNPGKKVLDTIILNGIEQILWPEHCVQNTWGSDFHKDLRTGVKNEYIFTKGSDKGIDSYSAFYDNKKNVSTGLHEFLKESRVSEIDVVGLALDFCVKYTCLDGKKSGYKVNVLLNGCKAISSDITPHLDEMKKAGISIV
jgi:nicotinamidase/pyrazinamidase